jgi:hypothetical protein
VLVRNKQGEGERHRERSLCRRVRANHTDRGFKKSGVADEEATSVKCGTTYMLKIKFSLGDARRCRCGIFGISYREVPGYAISDQKMRRFLREMHLPLGSRIKDGKRVFIERCGEIQMRDMPHRCKRFTVRLTASDM